MADFNDRYGNGLESTFDSCGGARDVQNTLNLALHERTKELGVGRRVEVVTAKDDVITACGEKFSDVRDTEAVVAVGEIWNDDADISGPLASKRTCDVIGLIAQAFCGCGDGNAPSLADAQVAIEGSRDGRCGATHVMSNITERDHGVTVAAVFLVVQSIA